MAERLRQQLQKLKHLQQLAGESGEDQKQLSHDIAEIASETSRLMVNEVLDWRVIFQDRPLKTT